MKVKVYILVLVLVFSFFVSSAAWADPFNIGMKIDFLDVGRENLPFFGISMGTEFIPSLESRLSISFNVTGDTVVSLLGIDGLYKLSFPGEILTPYFGLGLAYLTDGTSGASGGNFFGGLEVDNMSLEGGFIYFFESDSLVSRIGLYMSF
jgi:hypothetical protein